MHFLQVHKLDPPEVSIKEFVATVIFCPYFSIRDTKGECAERFWGGKVGNEGNDGVIEGTQKAQMTKTGALR